MGFFENLFWNWIYSIIVFLTGGFGIFMIRIIKKSWTTVKWSYIPIFWIPIVSSWPVSFAILFGQFD